MGNEKVNPEQKSSFKPNKELLNGPIDANRSCTDIICVFLFIAGLIAMFVVSFIGYA